VQDVITHVELTEMNGGYQTPVIIITML